MNRIIPFILLTVAFCSNLFGGTQLWNIITISDRPYNNVVLDKLENDTLYVKAYDKILPVPVDSIKYLIRQKQSHPGVGIVFGMVAGGFLGNKLVRDPRPDEGMSGIGTAIGKAFWTGVGIIGGGLIGYAVAHGLGADEYFDFTTRTHDKKISLLLKLMDQK